MKEKIEEIRKSAEEKLEQIKNARRITRVKSKIFRKKE